MDLLHEIGEEVCLFAPFEPGDMQFLTQHVTYHGRTPFRNDPTVGAYPTRAATHPAVRPV